MTVGLPPASVLSEKMVEMSSANVAARWAEALASWAIPKELLDAAPEDPWSLRVEQFRRAAHEAIDRETPTRRRALEALPHGGVVLDVGCGAGAMSAGLATQAGRIVGVDQSAAMLAAFAEQAEGLGVEHEAIEGGWPDVAELVPAGDVVVCGHVLYNVQGIESFLGALQDHARRRVVIELTDRHPRTWANPIWRTIHGINRPDRPTAEDALAVLAEMGIDAEVERWEQPTGFAEEDPDALVAYVRRYLCLTPDRDPDVRAALANDAPPRTKHAPTH